MKGGRGLVRCRDERGSNRDRKEERECERKEKRERESERKGGKGRSGKLHTRGFGVTGNTTTRLSTGLKMNEGDRCDLYHETVQIIRTQDKMTDENDVLTPARINRRDWLNLSVESRLLIRAGGSIQ